LSIGRIDPEDREFTAFYHVGFLFASTVAMAYFGSMQHALATKQNEHNDTAGDFCVELKGLPPDTTTTEVSQYFQSDFFRDLVAGAPGSPVIQQIILTKRVAAFLVKYREQRELQSRVEIALELEAMAEAVHDSFPIHSEERNELDEVITLLARITSFHIKYGT